MCPPYRAAGTRFLVIGQVIKALWRPVVPAGLFCVRQVVIAPLAPLAEEKRSPDARPAWISPVLRAAASGEFDQPARTSAARRHFRA